MPNLHANRSFPIVALIGLQAPQERHRCASHSLMASDGELGSLSAGTVPYLDFHLHMSFSNSSGVGSSC